jgi:uncharacterized protein YndB with AHSA1/START domain
MTATADAAAGVVRACVTLPAPPERVFDALASPAITEWWVRPGVFDTRTWDGEVRPGGRWRASGIGRGQAYTLEGEFLEVDAPRKLVHTWQPAGAPAAAATRVTYELESRDDGTLLTLVHEGFTNPDVCTGTCIGWETSFATLTEILANR